MSSTDESKATSVLQFMEVGKDNGNSMATRHLSLQWSRSVKKQKFMEPQIQQVFEPFGEITQILVNDKAKRTAIVSFAHVQHAEAAFEALGGKMNDAIDRRILHIAFAARRIVQDGYDEILRIPNISTNPLDECNANPSSVVPGLHLFYNFVSEQVETQLLEYLDTTDDATWNKMIARKVMHFGYEFDYKKRRCDSSKPLNNIPAVIQDVIAHFPEVMEVPDQVTANCYEPGQGIAQHIDTHSAFKGGIASLSLGSTTVMDFRSPEGTTRSIALPRRSLLVMTGEARYKWTHGFQDRKTDLLDGKQVPRGTRVSLTFRQICDADCACSYPEQCDTACKKRAAGEEPEKLCPTEMEKKYVHEFYETVSDHFSSTRYAPWPNVAEFVRSLPSGSLVADIGCGNGKYMACVNPESMEIGGDRSSSLINICQQRGFQSMVFDAMAVPLRTGAFDASLSIAVLHHLSTVEHRMSALRELVRVLRVGGRGLVYVWALEQQQSSKRSFEQHKQDIFVPWRLQKKFDKDSTDANVEEKIVQRYCHVYHEGELEELLLTLPNVEIEESYYDESNWCIRFCKTKMETSSV